MTVAYTTPRRPLRISVLVSGYRLFSTPPASMFGSAPNFGRYNRCPRATDEYQQRALFHSVHHYDIQLSLLGSRAILRLPLLSEGRLLRNDARQRVHQNIIHRLDYILRTWLWRSLPLSRALGGFLPGPARSPQASQTQAESTTPLHGLHQCTYR
ncbi:hypothetical protein EXIGLDRAFT_263083 [Exidia glandulosa HHB12029]|uniref:Uncharacterized protein n=1 Tax=Exidia glandulosa HHB12029 TaxID=1314781 RepID=A0A165DRF8_EXIGL|nr:hypothetical protein EXIGLDRAFT_263083 [Exidia glandulosa HHB12029]